MQFLQIFIVTVVCKQISNKKQQFLDDYDNDDAGSITSIVFHSIIGSIFLIFSAALIWYNERREAITSYRLVNMRQICKIGDCHEINQELNGELVHMQGQTTTDIILEDTEFGISLPFCIKLNRHVEQLQFVRIEHKHKFSSTTFTYEQRWQREQVCSAGFPSEYQNKPELWLVKNNGQINPDVRLGVFTLSEPLKQNCLNFQYFLPGDVQIKAAQELFGKEFPYITIKNCDIQLSQIENQKTIGDLRVSFSYVKCGNTTIISKQMNNTFIPYMIEDKWQSENSIHSDEMDQDSDHNCCYQIAQIAKANEEPLKQIHWINENIQSFNDIFKEQLIRNSDLTYKTRLKAFSLMVFGVAIFLQGTFDFGLPSDIQFFFFIGLGMIFSIPISLIIALMAWMRYHLFYTLTNFIGLAIVFSIVTIITGGIYY
ncbi:unnamed protein product [Paramecium pentaurelia]|uniref:Transmembrane protein n=1 Tax=Paramecium pentaurelia TaxID=43138 RepID=A0A8S1Y0N5_9CILI|nr:unnamed protein product [Paramecium pentaurelia]